MTDSALDPNPPNDDVTPDDAEPEPTPKPRIIREPEAIAGPPPTGFPLPSDLRMPRGKQVMFIQFRSRWTDTPWLGHPINPDDVDHKLLDEEGNARPATWRTCVCWPVNTADKRLAVARARGDQNRATDELTRQMIRVVDGKLVSWVDSTDIDNWWNEIGEKCRQRMMQIFSQLHIMDQDDTIDFLENCIAIRRT